MTASLPLAFGHDGGVHPLDAGRVLRRYRRGDDVRHEAAALVRAGVTG